MSDTVETTDAADPDGNAVDDAPAVPDCTGACSWSRAVSRSSTRHDQYLPLIKALVDDGYTMCVDLTGVDYLEHMARPLPEGINGERFEVVVNLLDLRDRRRLRLRVQVPDPRRSCRRSSTSTPGPRRWSARRSTCSGSASADTRISPAS